MEIQMRENSSSLSELKNTTLTSLLGLEGRNAVVSGGSSGIGLAVTCLFARIGMKVHVFDKVPIGLRDHEMLGSEITYHPLDVTDKTSCITLARKVASEHGKIATLVNAAGIVLPDTDHGASSVMEAMFACNVLGTAHLCEALLPHFEAESATIVNIGSVVATFGWQKRAGYCASKGALEAMSRALALEYVSRNIRLNVVAPGIVATPLMSTIIHSQKDPQQAFQERASLQATGRLLDPAEIANTVLYLASNLSSGVIGATIDVSAGRVAGHLPPRVLDADGEAAQDRAWIEFCAPITKI